MSSPTLAKLHYAAFPVLLPGAPSTRIAPIDPDGPATQAMTDFRSALVNTIRNDASIEDALQHMKQAGGRLCFVVGAEGQLLGSITADDILGERPVKYMLSTRNAQACLAWRDVQVQHIMEAVVNWRVLDYAQVLSMRAAEMAQLLRESGQRYLVVVEETASGCAWQMRGLFSASRLQALLGGDRWSPLISRGMTSVMLRDGATSEPSSRPYA